MPLPIPLDDLDDLVRRLRDLGDATAEAAAETLCEYDLALRATLTRLDEARREQVSIRESFAAVSR